VIVLLAALLPAGCVGSTGTPSPQITVVPVQTAAAAVPSATVAAVPSANAARTTSPVAPSLSPGSIPEALQGTWVFLNQPNPPDPAAKPGEYTQYVVLNKDHFAFESFKTPATPPPFDAGGDPTTGPASVSGDVITFMPSPNACYADPNGKGTYRWALVSPTELRTTLIGTDPCPRAAVLRAGHLRLFSRMTIPLP
jgi:hypothetical protein